MNNNLNLDEKVIKEYRRKQDLVHWYTKFNFINQHNGIRPNKMHLFVAPTHVGKSTLTHALIDDLVVKNPMMKILVYLTEESKEDFESSIASFTRNYESLNSQVTVLVENKRDSDDAIKDKIETTVVHGNYDLVVIDNITTSKIYGDRLVSFQTEIAMWLKGLLEDTALYIIAHTNGNNYNTELLDETHIRGSKTITNISEFLYVMQPIRLNDSLYQFIRIIKHRGQSPKNKFYRLNYDERLKTIASDLPVSFDDFKEIFKLRNKL